MDAIRVPLRKAISGREEEEGTGDQTHDGQARTAVSDTKMRKWADQESNKNLWKSAVGDDDGGDRGGDSIAVFGMSFGTKIGVRVLSKRFHFSTAGAILIQ